MTQFLVRNKVALIIILGCLPLAMKLIRPNGLYGFRFGSAFESSERWYAINRTGAVCVIAALMSSLITKEILWSQNSAYVEVVTRHGSVIDTAAFGLGIAATLALIRK